MSEQQDQMLQGVTPKKRGRKKKSEIVQNAVSQFVELQKEQLKLFEFLIKENDRLQAEIGKNKKYKDVYQKIQKFTSESKGEQEIKETIDGEGEIA